MRMMAAARHFLLLALCLSLTSRTILAQTTGIKGHVLNQKKEALPFASVAVKGTSTGTIANEEGAYQLNLPPGYYEIVFQYLGYQTGAKAITISSSIETFDAVLAEQALELYEVKIGKGKEDPAYAIMRRAIAKSKYHLLQVDSYKAKAYTKSSIVITDLPLEFLYKKELEEFASEGNFRKGVPLLNETVSDIEFKQPNTYKQKVIAARNSQDNRFANPNEYLLSSFYKPDVVQTVSPLSPKAFGYYKFEYLGTFREDGADVSKIKVIPRAYGDGVFRGTIHIIEDQWSIHSLNLETVKMGIELKIKQIYRPVQQVWMPVQQQFHASGGLYGLKGKADYVISQTFQSLQLNPNFPPDVVVLDPKSEKAEIKTLPSTGNTLKNKELDELLSSGQKISAKNLRKLMKSYEKQQFEETKQKGEDVDMIEKRETSTEIDSMATRRATSFWDSLRTVPLTQAEIKSYKNLDSLVVKRKIEQPSQKNDRLAEEEDPDASTGKRKNGKVKVGDFLWGHSFPISNDKRWRIDYTGPIKGLQVNTVEGLVSDGAGLGIRHSKKADRKLGSSGHQFSMKGSLRYSLERKLLSPRGELNYSQNGKTLSVEGGRSISQLNAANPISFLLNSLTTLFFEQNFAKIYQKDYVRVNFRQIENNDHFTINGYVEYADRTGLSNATHMNRYRWIDWRNHLYTSNDPIKISDIPEQPVDYTLPAHHLAVTAGISASYKPWQKYRVKAGKTTYYKDDSPELYLSYRTGIPDLFGSDLNFNFVQFRFRHGLQTGIKSKLYYIVSAGTFIGNTTLGFQDFHHFAGNRFFFQFGDPVSTFRMLDYYRFSTKSRFAEGHLLAEFRQLFFTQIPWFRKYGIKETFMIHALATPPVEQYLLPDRPGSYVELGYGFDVGIRFPFRVELISSFEGLKYRETGFRIGTSMNLPFQ
jgi:hypothetical protein